MNFRKILSASLMIAAAITGGNTVSALTAEEFITPGKNNPKYLKEMRPMSDGVSYAMIGADGKTIDTYDYKTGKKLSTLFNIDDIKGDLKIDSFDGYRISDNGKKILLWNDVTKIYRRSFTAQYYVYDTFRMTLKRVSNGGAQRGATMSHDGRMVAYVRDNNIYISNLDYDTDTAITKDGVLNSVINGAADWSYEEEFSVVNTMRWNADDTVLAYMRFDETEVPMYSFDHYKSFCEQNPLSDPYPASYTYKYPLAGYPNSKVSVLAYNLDNRTTKKMEFPAAYEYIPHMEFDGSGSQLMVMTMNRNQNHLRLYKVNPASTVATQILEEQNGNWISKDAFGMVKYGKDSFVIGSSRSGWLHLYEYNYSGTLLRQITKGNWNVTNYYGRSARTGMHYVQTTIRGAINRNVCSVDAKGIVTALNNVDGFESASFSGNMEYYVRSYSNALTPTAYTLCNSKGAMLKEIENNSEYAAKYASAPRKEFLKVKNDEGKEMDAFIIKPANFDSSKHYPLVMTQYNGPESQEVSNNWAMSGVYYLASQGYVIAAVDGRGTGYREREWATCVYKHLGEYETADQLAGARYFASLPYIDSKKVGCFGWSYGGYMSLMELSAKDCPFKCGAAMAPVTDWRFYDSIYTERYMSTPQQNEKGYIQSSTFGRTSDLKARLLIISGTSDDNVHFYNTLKYTSKLNYEGKVFDMMAITGFEHSLTTCNARVMLFKKIEDFFNIYLK